MDKASISSLRVLLRRLMILMGCNSLKELAYSLKIDAGALDYHNANNNMTEFALHVLAVVCEATQAGINVNYLFTGLGKPIIDIVANVRYVRENYCRYWGDDLRVFVRYLSEGEPMSDELTASCLEHEIQKRLARHRFGMLLEMGVAYDCKV